MKSIANLIEVIKELKGEKEVILIENTVLPIGVQRTLYKDITGVEGTEITVDYGKGEYNFFVYLPEDNSKSVYEILETMRGINPFKITELDGTNLIDIKENNENRLIIAINCCDC